MKITDEQILKRLIDIRDNGKTKLERTRAGAILLSNSDLIVNMGAYFSTFSYNSQDNNRLNLASYFY
jgi:hypothetical protein